MSKHEAIERLKQEIVKLETEKSELEKQIMASYSPSVRKEAVALYDYCPRYDDDLELHTGGVVTVEYGEEAKDQPWLLGKRLPGIRNVESSADHIFLYVRLTGEYKGKVGLVASSYIRLVETGEAPEGISTEEQVLVALFDYSGQRSDELSFVVGDQIALQVAHTTGWWLGTNLRTGEKALFPSNYATAQEESNNHT